MDLHDMGTGLGKNSVVHERNFEHFLKLEKTEILFMSLITLYLCVGFH